jgi:hypothetical protein
VNKTTKSTKKPASPESAKSIARPSLCAAIGSELTPEQAKHFDWLWNGATADARSRIPDKVRKHVEEILGHALSIS